MACEPRPERGGDSQRKRTLDEVFGEVLPETTSDEREPGTRRHRESSDDWYRENRPPHHDR